jgi:long-chain acyl-CoA synthetase
MRGYYELPEETAAAFTPDGYLKTGDLGYLDSENYLYLTGRAKNLIVTDGGKNVYPEEIENEFQLYEEIDQILIRSFTVDQKLRTEGIEALVYPNPEWYPKDKPQDEIQADIEKIVSTVNQRLLPYQRINRTILLEEPMEMTTTKKIKRGST